MALANFFHKDALAISQVLRDQNTESFKEILSEHIVCIAFDKKAIASDEGKCLLDLSIRLLARLYPKVNFKSLNGNYNNEIEKFKSQAKEINPQIDFIENEEPSVVLVIGETKFELEDIPTFYIGSDGWITKFSNSYPIGLGDTNNPFGAGAAACFGAVNVFRFIFNDSLDENVLDQTFDFSLKSFQKVKEYPDQKSLVDTNLDELHLIGIGAIGNGAIWALSKIDALKGDIHLIDHEKLTKSNLQRYVLADQSNKGNKKVHLGANYFEQSNVDVFPHYNRWETYLQNEKNWNFENLGVCVDSAEDRIKIQGSLPKTITNAYTDIKLLGISRHINFIDEPCLACAYVPTEKKKDYSVKVAESLSLGDHEKKIREYLYYSKPVDKQILNLIAEANNIPLDKISEFEGIKLDEFYSEVVCGGILMDISGSKNPNEQFEAPLAFQSALAGILLASEILIQKNDLRKKKLPSSSQINILAPLNQYQPNHFNLEKNDYGNCICGDEDYKNAYIEKWQ